MIKLETGDFMTRREIIKSMIMDFETDGGFSIVCDVEFDSMAGEFWEKIKYKLDSFLQPPVDNLFPKKDDFILVISRSGKSDGIIDRVKSSLKAKVKIYAICGDFRSPLSLLSDNVIVLEDNEFFTDNVLQILDEVYENVSGDSIVSGRKKSQVLDETAFFNPMMGAIVKLKVGVGDEVKKGDVLYVIEAMKMEMDVQSDRDGVISEIHIEAGDAVEYRDVVMNFE
ncbi:MAG: hypothetical protein IJ287_07820 [Methanobrevibacter sp.]|nr:hypothetical protein [Methanobrevibacter sp.]